MAGLPHHLRRFVVEQDYSQYNAVDHAVWRFILLQTYARLVNTAHPVYREGLAATGISVERIPRIEEMNQKLSRFGWGAVCVDGFVPPRAFQEFQACGVLPIAAEMRSRAHLVYTPAPDIVHEAAGHAPILPDPGYATYLRRIGQLGAEAFTVPAEDRVFQAIYALSEMKEDPAATAEAIVGAETTLGAATAAVDTPSEAARLSRLYWWTAEYGLVGRPDDYKIYGAGLLSSLGESNSCHAPAVRKLPLDVTCMDVAYDITRAQPQLYVTPSFEALHDVLADAERTLAVRRGGEEALAAALASDEVGSFRFDDDLWIIGRLVETGAASTSQGAGRPTWMAFDGPIALAIPSATTPGASIATRLSPAAAAPAAHLLPTGRLADGRPASALTERDLDRARDDETGRTRLAFAGGVIVDGVFETYVRAPNGKLQEIAFRDAQLTLPGRAPVRLARYRFWPMGDFVTARAGAIDPDFHPDEAHVPVRVPRPRQFPAREQRLLQLYQQAERAARDLPDAFADHFAQVHAVLDLEFPDEWLLRWNLLESLLKRRSEFAPADRATEDQARRLQTELVELEARYQQREPIASGLRYLALRTD